MKLADKGLNAQAEALEEAQTQIRLAVRNGYLNSNSKPIINAEVQEIIRAVLKRIQISDLRSAAYRSLNGFAERQYATYKREFGASPVLLLAVISVANNKPGTAVYEKARRALSDMPPRNFNPPTDYTTHARGVPLQMYSQDYLTKYITPAFDRILAQKPLDPDDLSGRNSLRNRAEMEVRYNAHEESISALKGAGVKLVVCSVHADCSSRCAKWQGRVYSLDGTSGITDDGKRYVPLEEARDVYYTTKAGKTYKNGLLGFNCRHALSPYHPGMVIPHVSAEERKREYAINIKQRELERRVREEREKALIYKGVNRERYLSARRQAIDANKEYIEFSKNNGRAYYPSRTKLL